MSSLGHVLGLVLLSVFINSPHNEINMEVKCVDDTKLGGIIPVFKDSIRFQVDLKELEKFFILFFFFPNNIERIHCGEDVDHIGCKDKNMHN